MIIQNEKVNLELVNMENHEGKQFNIKQNKRMFEILSSNIYSDKISAVLREYGCNALDSHIAAGKADEPFIVHLPNSFEPWFSVKDNGIGLSHEQVMNLYTTYGDSSKSESNDFVGALGLGSKSAFAYTDQFTVTSRFDGVIRVYSAYVNEDGTPCILLLSEDLTEDVNGVEIYMPVDAADFYAFGEKAAQVFFRFPVLPTIIGNTITLPQVNYVVEYGNYKLRNRNSRYDDTKSWAIQGPIAYPINTSFLSEMTQEDKNILANTPFDIHFPMGSLNIAVSREALSYDKSTKLAIQKALDTIKESIASQFKNVFDDCKTLYEAKIKYSTWLKDAGGAYSYNTEFKRLIQQSFSFNGQEINNETLRFSTHKTDPDGKITTPMVYGMIAAYRGGSINQPYVHNNIKIDIDDSTKLIFVNQNLDNKFLNKIIWYNMRGLYSTRHWIVVKLLPDSDLKALQDHFHGMPYTLVSDLDRPPEGYYDYLNKTTTGRSTKSTVPTVKMYKINSFFENSVDGEANAIVDTTKPAYYFLTYQRLPVIKGTEDKPKISSKFFNKLHAAKKLGLLKGISNVIYTVNYSQQSTLKGYKNLICMHEKLEDLVKPFQKPSVSKLISAIDLYEDIFYSWLIFFKDEYKYKVRMETRVYSYDDFIAFVGESISKKSSIYKMIVKYVKLHKKLNNLVSYDLFDTDIRTSSNLLKVLDIKLTVDESLKAELIVEEKALQLAYPCFLLLSCQRSVYVDRRDYGSRRVNVERADIYNYINLHH